MRKFVIAFAIAFAVVAGSVAPANASWTHGTRYFTVDRCHNVSGLQSSYWLSNHPKWHHVGNTCWYWPTSGPWQL